MKGTYIFFTLTFFLLFSCTYEKIRVVEDEFEPYLESFREEAQLRGLNYDDQLEEISIVLSRIVEGTISGTCYADKEFITIDSLWWKNLDEQEREHLVFHELGHCILGRPHQDDTTDRGECITYMRSSSTVCSSNYYSTIWRKYYLDELFDTGDTTSIYWYTPLNEDYERQLLVDTSFVNTGYHSVNYDLTENLRFEITMTWRNWTDITNILAIRFNRINFDFSKGDIMIYNTEGTAIDRPTIKSQLYYQNEDFDWTEWIAGPQNEVEMRITNTDRYCSFYVNDRLVHRMSNLEFTELSFDSIELFTIVPLSVQFARLL